MNAQMNSRTIRFYGGVIILSRLPGSPGWSWQAWRPVTPRDHPRRIGINGWGVAESRRRAWRSAIEALR